MARGSHYEDLVDNEIFLGLFLQVHLLDGYGKICAHLIGCINAPGCTDNFFERSTQSDGDASATHPCPILTKLRYNRVGSASVQICCKRFTISISFSLSFSFFSLRRGVATPEVAADAFAKLAAAGL